MKSIVLVAGLGTRMRPHTFTTPKPLLPVAGHPILKYILDMLAAIPQMEEFDIVVGHFGDQIQAWVEAHYKIPARFFLQQNFDGQAPAVALTRPTVRGDAIIIFGDGILQADFSGLADFRADALAFVKAVDDPSRLGVALVENDFVTRLIEKPATPVSKLALAGMYYVREMKKMYDAIDEQIAKNIRTRGEFFLADTFNVMLARGARMQTRVIQSWLDAGTIESWLATNRALLQRNGSREISTTNSTIIPPVFIADNVKISRSTIGPFVSVSVNAVIENSTVRDSIIAENARVQNSTLDQSVVGAGARVENFRGKLNVASASVVDGTS